MHMAGVPHAGGVPPQHKDGPGVQRDPPPPRVSHPRAGTMSTSRLLAALVGDVSGGCGAALLVLG